MPNTAFDRRYPHVRADHREAYWPDDVFSVSMKGQNWFGMDSSGQLYWDGKLIALPIRLSFWQRVGGVATVLSAVTVAVVQLVRIIWLG